MAWLVNGLVQRPTEDVDLFTDTEDGVSAAAGEVTAALIAAGYSVARETTDELFDGHGRQPARVPGRRRRPGPAADPVPAGPPPGAGGDGRRPGHAPGRPGRHQGRRAGQPARGPRLHRRGRRPGPLSAGPDPGAGQGGRPGDRGRTTWPTPAATWTGWTTPGSPSTASAPPRSPACGSDLQPGRADLAPGRQPGPRNLVAGTLPSRRKAGSRSTEHGRVRALVPGHGLVYRLDPS